MENSKRKLELLEDPPETSTSKNFKPSIEMEMENLNLLNLPELVLVKIIAYLDIKSRLKTSLVCKRFQNLVFDNANLLENMKLCINFSDSSIRESKITGKFSHCKITGSLSDDFDMEFFGENIRKFLKTIDFLSLETTRSSFETFLNLFPNLEEMTIRSVIILDPIINPPEIKLDRLWKMELLGYPSMVKLSDIQSNCLLEYLKHWRNLEVIHANYEYSTMLAEISRLQENLKELITYGTFNWNLIENLQLEVLQVKYLENVGEFVTSLKNLDNSLKYLNFEVNVMSVSDLQILFENVLSMRNLEVLNIKIYFGFPDLRDLEFFSKYTSNLKQLKIIDINCLNISKRDFIVPLLKSCPNLEKLYLLLPVCGLPMLSRRLWKFNCVFRNEFTTRLLKVVEKQNQSWVFNKMESPPDFLKSNGKDFQFWHYLKVWDFILNEDFVKLFQDLESLLVFLTSFSQIAEIIKAYKNLKILRIAIKGAIMLELEILRNNEEIKFRLEHPFYKRILECDLDGLESLINEILNIRSSIDGILERPSIQNDQINELNIEN